jgi:hypothetical protein
MMRSWVSLLALAVVPLAHAAPTRTSPIAVAAGDVVFVVNPDSGTVARLDFSGLQGALTHEVAVGAYPRTVTLAGASVYTADQNGDGVTRCDQADLANCTSQPLGPGCNPYGITATPSGDALLVACQGTSELVILTPSLGVTTRVKLDWPNARGIAVASDGSKAYVSHFLTEEPGTDGHVSVVDLANKSIATVFPVTVDDATCETQNSGRGVLNQLTAIALVPDGAPADVAGQLWVGGVQQNNVTKGLFKRYQPFKNQAGAVLFPHAPFAPTPEGASNRNIYRPSFHDVTRFGIVKLNAANGTRVGKIDVDEANHATDIEFSPDGTAAFVVDQMFNSYHVFNTRRGQGTDVTTIFASPSAFSVGGADPAQPCISNALTAVVSEAPFRVAPQAQLTPIDGYNPTDANFQVVATGVDFDSVAFVGSGISRMRPVTDSIGTAPIGVRLTPDGEKAFVFNYLSRNVVPVATSLPLTVDGKPENLRCAASPAVHCGMNNDCPGGTGFCNHPGGAACATDAECGSNGPCIFSNDCVPLLLGQATSTITGRCENGSNPGASCKSNADCAGGGTCNGIAGDVLPPAILDGKILFNTAARDASVPNDIGLGQAAPLFNQPRTVCANNPSQPCIHHPECGDPNARLCSVSISVPGEIVSTAHDASYVTCTACHADFGGQDGRTWDFSQFGASLRNTMDLRGRAAIAPGHCGNDASQECFFDAACGDGNTCLADPATIPPNIPAADRDRWFNPMITIHWNGDRDEVEDFEFTIRQLQGAADCDANEQNASCPGGLVQRTLYMVNELPRPNRAGENDVETDLGPPNRNLPGTAGTNVGHRLTHMADFVYSLTDFVKNPNQPNEQSEEGRRIFNDPSVGCVPCHAGGPTGKQFFTDKAVAPGTFDPGAPPRADQNNPYLRHDVGTANLFDVADPFAVASDSGIFQNAVIPIPGSRGTLGAYVTPVLNDVWNSAPYLHDGSAHTLLDVVRPCTSALDDCLVPGMGRNIDDKHGVTSRLTPRQLEALVAFQNVLTTDTVLGNPDAVVKAGTLTFQKVKLNFGRVRDGVRGAGKVLVKGTLENAPVPVDPRTTANVQLATPGDGAMAILEIALPVSGRGRRSTGKAPIDGGAVVLRLRESGNGFRFLLKGKGELGDLDTGTPALTVAMQFGEAQYAGTRSLVLKKGVYKLPKRKRS